MVATLVPLAGVALADWNLTALFALYRIRSVSPALSRQWSVADMEYEA